MTADCTLTTACFDLSKYNTGSRSIDDTIRGMLPVLKLPVFMVIYSDKTFMGLIREIRRTYGLADKTVFNEGSYETLWCAELTTKVASNREKYWPSRDARTCSESHLLTCNKFDFVLQTMSQNPFSTSRFGWIDMNLYMGDSRNIKICEDYSEDVIPALLNNLRDDKFHIQILNVADKGLLGDRREFYSKYRYIACGSFFVCGAETGYKILTRLKEIVVSTTNEGYGHSEEPMYFEILDEFYGDIVRSYGDYGQILNNFEHPVRNMWYIYYNIIIAYIEFGYHRECIDCCRKMLRSYDEGRVEMDAILYAKIQAICGISEYNISS